MAKFLWILYIGFVIAAILEHTRRRRIYHIARKTINIVLIILFLLQIIVPALTKAPITFRYLFDSCVGLAVWFTIFTHW